MSSAASPSTRGELTSSVGRRCSKSPSPAHQPGYSCSCCPISLGPKPGVAGLGACRAATAPVPGQLLSSSLGRELSYPFQPLVHGRLPSSGCPMAKGLVPHLFYTSISLLEPQLSLVLQTGITKVTHNPCWFLCAHEEFPGCGEEHGQMTIRTH